jgi:hypothetical protein
MLSSLPLLLLLLLLLMLMLMLPWWCSVQAPQGAPV